MPTRQNGFAHILLLITLVIVIMIGIGFLIRQQSSPPPKLTSATTTPSPSPQEVPASLPDSTMPPITSPSPKPNSASPKPTNTPNSAEKRLSALEDSLYDIRSRLSILENASPAPAGAPTSVSTTKYPLYLDFGTSTFGSSLDYITLDTPELTIDPTDYPGYTNMQLIVSALLFQGNGTGYIRLYNNNDSTSILASEVSTSSQTYTTLTSNKFTLPTSSKTYRLQIRSTTGYSVYIQSAKIRINFN